MGNAPTALIRMAQLIRAGAMSPALILAVPVGFVNVVESKEEILALARGGGIPAIAALGRKGGSTVAAAPVQRPAVSVGRTGEIMRRGKDRLIGGRPLPAPALWGGGVPRPRERTRRRWTGSWTCSWACWRRSSPRRSGARPWTCGCGSDRCARPGWTGASIGRGDREQELLEELNGLYEAYTIRYLGGRRPGLGLHGPGGTRPGPLPDRRGGGAHPHAQLPGPDPRALDQGGPGGDVGVDAGRPPKGRLSGTFGAMCPLRTARGETVAYVLPADPGEPVGDLPGPGGHGGTGTIFWRPCSTSTATTSP